MDNADDAPRDDEGNTWTNRVKAIQTKFDFYGNARVTSKAR